MPGGESEPSIRITLTGNQMGKGGTTENTVLEEAEEEGVGGERTDISAVVCGRVV